jgi:hypothetical protein
MELLEAILAVESNVAASPLDAAAEELMTLEARVPDISSISEVLRVLERGNDLLNTINRGPDRYWHSTYNSVFNLQRILSVPTCSAGVIYV